MKKENKGRNVLNVGEVENFLDSQLRGKSKSFQQWIRSNLRNHLVNQQKAKLVLPANMRSTLLALSVVVGNALSSRKSQIRLADNFHFVKESQQPDWFKRAFADGDEIYQVVFDEEDLAAQISHWHDYVRADLADKDISRITVDEMVKQTEAWVKRLQREKVLSDDLKNVTPLWEDKTYRLVRLDAKDAYVLEGQRMHNCVKSYWQDGPRGSIGRQPYEIYSLRTLDNEPVLTVEAWEFDFCPSARLRMRTAQVVRYLVVRQAKAHSNAKPTKAILAQVMKALIAAFPGRSIVFESQLPMSAATSFRQLIASDEANDEDDDEEEEDYEDEDDEVDEEDEDEDAMKEEDYDDV